MVVGAKERLQPRPLLLRQGMVQEAAVQLFRREGAHFFAQLSQGLLLRPLALHRRCAQMQGGDQILDHHVAGEGPPLPLHRRVQVHMAEHAVQDAVQIVPGGVRPFLFIAQQHVHRRVGVAAPVRPGRAPGHGRKLQAAQGPLHKAQMQQQ